MSIFHSALFVDMFEVDRLRRLLARARLGLLDAVRGAPKLVVMGAIGLQLRVDDFLEKRLVRCGNVSSLSWHGGPHGTVFRKYRASSGYPSRSYGEPNASGPREAL
jgi:hypothetical protein